ncbi:trafficking protein particle complex subunit 2, partial [Tremellales sp. Uapishka_1]
MSFYLVIVSPLDSPLFELSFPSAKPPSSATAASSPANIAAFPSWSTFTSSTGSDLAPHETSKVLGGVGVGVGGMGGSDRSLLQMIANKSLDSIEEVMEGTGTLYLRNVDRYNEWMVSAFVAASVKFVLLHDVKNEDGIRVFFLDVWENYVKTLLNPFCTVNTSIRNVAFESKLRASAKRNL